MTIDEMKMKIVPLLQKYRVTRAALFGSAARGESSARDIDMLVAMARPYSLFSFLNLKGELEDRLGAAIDLIEYSQIKPSLRKYILRDEVKIV